MTFGCNFWLEMGIWDWGLELGIGIGDWDLGLGCGIWDLNWGLRFGVRYLNQKLGLSNGITIDEKLEWKLQLIFNIELILIVVGLLDL